MPKQVRHDTCSSTSSVLGQRALSLPKSPLHPELVAAARER
ncbi:MAG: hypothetical protein Q8O92_06340 [Candidatus Latescibacter sp.]|nr:hypothetical protein [Candidatus Latescibacter sp.]